MTEGGGSFGLAAGILLLSPPWLAFLWHLVTFRIRPLLIPARDIRAMADALVLKHGDLAEEMAFIEEDAAWRRSDVFLQGRWRRVRRELRRRAGVGIRDPAR